MNEMKVGEVMQVGFKKVKCVENKGCGGCLFDDFYACDIIVGSCDKKSRTDGKDVIFIDVTEE